MGHGDPVAPGGGFSVEAQRLVDAAARWDDIRSKLRTAGENVSADFDLTGLFGIADALYTASGKHAAFNAAMVTALETGATAAGLLADGLVETANDYAGTDTSAADNFGVPA
ncbi:hypothetical protein INN71_02095 [Nocardioides sp. ChNu-153]|uniref:hypothetical protein n=1 Tax=unclassified Nocardioides TaxID=2615069 RepID=UPI002404A982|nr:MULTISPECIES: hypothetical protein [unclassified Nocardioides]MDF9717729.1 hypothetical protein [Nocardioides sp. ChNu-99]MDN7120175.1 hypothetical protein [Nocardioides sp. ChNu-153]